jgi:hypothetical protein
VLREQLGASRITKMNPMAYMLPIRNRVVSGDAVGSRSVRTTAMKKAENPMSRPAERPDSRRPRASRRISASPCPTSSSRISWEVLAVELSG